MLHSVSMMTECHMVSH